MKAVFIGLLILLSLVTNAQPTVCGKYQTVVLMYGMFGETITLNCDSTTIVNFSGDMMDDNSHGKWSLNRDTLTIVFDSLAHPGERYKEPMSFKVKKNKLLNFSFTRGKYNALRDSINAYSKRIGKSIRIPSYHQFNKMYEGEETDYKGKRHKQYYRKKESFNCVGA